MARPREVVAEMWRAAAANAPVVCAVACLEWWRVVGAGHGVQFVARPAADGRRERCLVIPLTAKQTLALWEAAHHWEIVQTIDGPA